MMRVPGRSKRCLVLVVVLGSLPVVAQSKLPPTLAALVPAGAQVTSQSFAKAPTLAAADFAAEKKLPANHTAYFNFHISAQDAASPLWKMREPIYRQEMADKVAAKRNSFKAGTVTPITYDPLNETSYGWGRGITQRVVHHYVGAGTGPDYVDYHAVYYGVTNGIIFELSVEGVINLDEADQWAKNVAAKLSNLNVSSLNH